MAVHSFRSLEEIYAAKEGEEREAVRAKVLAESKSFDASIRKAVANEDPAARRKALLDLESLYEFKRSHPTVEVSRLPLKILPKTLLTLPSLAFHSAPGRGWLSSELKGRAPGR